MKKRILSLVLTLTMIAGICTFAPLSVSAEMYSPVAIVDWNGHTYHLYIERMTWKEAKQYCEEIGGHLVTITSSEEQKIVEGLLEGQPDADFYIGLHRDTNEFETWITGELVTYKNWGDGEPDDAFGGQSTGIIANGTRSGSNYHIEFGEWDDTSDGGGGFICEFGEENHIENDTKSFMEQIEGVYVGRYTAIQGVTGATLTIEETDNGVFSTIFEFYPVYDNAGVESGSYILDVLYEDSKYEMIGTEWVEKAPTYIFVDLKNVKYDGYSLSGDVYGQKAGFLGLGTTYSEVGEFEFIKVGASDDSIFEFGRDNFSFVNTGSHFNSSINKYYVDTQHSNYLLENQSNSVKYNILSNIISDWSGSCYGMSAVAYLNTLSNKLNLSSYNANTLYNMDMPANDLRVKSLINYYHMTQYMPDVVKEMQRQAALHSDDRYYFINRLLDEAFEIAETQKPILIGYYWYLDESGNLLTLNDKKNAETVAGHAVLVYDIKVTKNGYMLYVYNPNNTENEIITISKDLKICKFDGKEYFADNYDDSTFEFGFITSDEKIIDLKNIEGRSNNISMYDYKDIYFVVKDGKKFDVETGYGKVFSAFTSKELSGENMIVMPSTTADGHFSSNVTYIMENTNYTVIPSSNDFNGTMIYSNNTINANVKNAEVIDYSNNGEVKLSGEDMDYSTALVKESPYFGEIYQVSASGSNANEIMLTNKNGGVLLTGDNLKNVKLEAVGDEITDTFEIDGNYDDLYICGNNDITKVYSDLDENGYYGEDEIIEAINHNSKKTSFGSEVSDWAKEEVEEAYNENLVPEVLVGKDLTQKVDRAEFAAIAVALYENLTGSKATKSNNPFNDVYGNACEDEILKAYNLDITTGTSATTFDPNTNITREQMATMLTRAYKKSEFKDWTIAKDDDYPLNFMGVQKFADDNEISDYAKESVYFMARWDIIKGVGDNKFAPKNSATLGESYGYATREQAVIIALRSAKHL